WSSDVCSSDLVHDGVNVFGQLVDRARVANVAFDESQAAIVTKLGQVFLASSIGELVQDGDGDLLIRLETLPDKGRADEPGTAGHQHSANVERHQDLVCPRNAGRVRYSANVMPRASFAETIGLETGQFIAISGSFQIMVASAEGS